MAKYTSLTVDQLKSICDAEIRKGNGKRHILISSDDEGNEFHELFYGLTSTDGFFDGPYPPSLPFNVSPEDAETNFMILG